MKNPQIFNKFFKFFFQIFKKFSSYPEIPEFPAFPWKIKIEIPPFFKFFSPSLPKKLPKIPHQLPSQNLGLNYSYSKLQTT